MLRLAGRIAQLTVLLASMAAHADTVADWAYTTTEIATDGPGFTIDETAESLGSRLSLPPWFNVRRDQLDVTLPPIVVPTTATTGAEH